MKKGGHPRIEIQTDPELVQLGVLLVFDHGKRLAPQRHYTAAQVRDTLRRPSLWLLDRQNDSHAVVKYVNPVRSSDALVTEAIEALKQQEMIIQNEGQGPAVDYTITPKGEARLTELLAQHKIAFVQATLGAARA